MIAFALSLPEDKTIKLVESQSLLHIKQKVRIFKTIKTKQEKGYELFIWAFAPGAMELKFQTDMTQDTLKRQDYNPDNNAHAKRHLRSK